MIIAPLMRPIMATAAGLVMGDMKQAGLSLLVVVARVTSEAGVRKGTFAFRVVVAKFARFALLAIALAWIIGLVR